MIALQTSCQVEPDRLSSRRAVALANAKWFRDLARRALRDGGPKGALRAAKARAAARIVIQKAKREALVSRMATGALTSDLPARAFTSPSVSSSAGMECTPQAQARTL